ncbi:hypothetical protein F3Y22_tig00109971pilonHSYRG00029 [Hibiscus syriacus]|uniref:DUF4283 domain-containing protein n=1 Tax=Hibiscus syriacus TaxID=106335 RepID=A0A6A3BTV2_HIBSY|nr:hypothetical protein F3Y22_tig00109971pilonHSYRG00029 [Hibiscus syriacus]
MPTNPLDADAFMHVFRVVWGTTRLVEVSSLGEDTFLFKLSSDIAMDYVFSRTPWTFNGDLVSLQSYDPSRGIGEYEFNCLPIWVRVYDLPLGWVNARVWDLIAKKLGEPLAVDLRTGAGRLGSHLRIRVIRFFVDSRQSDHPFSTPPAPSCFLHCSESASVLYFSVVVGTWRGEKVKVFDVQNCELSSTLFKIVNRALYTYYDIFRRPESVFEVRLAKFEPDKMVFTD